MESIHMMTCMKYMTLFSGHPVVPLLAALVQALTISYVCD